MLVSVWVFPLRPWLLPGLSWPSHLCCKLLPALASPPCWKVKRNSLPHMTVKKIDIVFTCFVSLWFVIFWTCTNQEENSRCYILPIQSIKTSLEPWFGLQESLVGPQGLPLSPTSCALLLPVPLQQCLPTPQAAMERTKHFSAFSAHLSILPIPLNNSSEDFNVVTTFLCVAITDFVFYFITHANSCLQSSGGGMQSSGYTDYSFIQRDYAAVNSIWTSI